LADQFETGLRADGSTASTSDERHTHVLTEMERSWISKLVADDDDDPDVDDVEDDLTQDVIHLELLDAPFSGSL